MSAILIISALLIFAASFALLRTRRAQSTAEPERLPPGFTPRGLFDEAGPEDGGGDRENAQKIRAGELRERASGGDLGALREASESGDHALYRFVLDGLVGRSAGDPVELRRLSSFIARGDGLRSSPELAEVLLGEWRRAPAPDSTADLLRVSALSDDAGTFGRAVDEVLHLWENGGLGGVGAETLRSLFEAEYWLLSSEAKRSGGGFVLKQKLADARRRLSAGARGGQANTDAGPALDGSAQEEIQ